MYGYNGFQNLMQTTHLIKSKILLLLTLLAASNSISAQYSGYLPQPQYIGTLANTGRKINSISLQGTSTPLQTITCGTNSSFIDKTDNSLFVREGETATASFTWSGGWMHGYIYIDKNNDGVFNNITLGANGIPTESSELVAYSAYAPDGNNYKNSTGSTTSSNPGLNPPSFTAPSTAGIYHMRFMTDWNAITPSGGNQFQSASGVAIDVALHVVKEYTLVVVNHHSGANVSIDGATEDSYATSCTILTTNPNLTIADITATDTRGGTPIVTIAGNTITVTFEAIQIVKIPITDLNQITSHDSYYELMEDIDASSATIIDGFTGTLDGGFHTISGLTHALFSNLDGATIKNVILDDVNITSGTDVGAIANTATGDTRIYNCGILSTNSSTISGSGNVGSLVGNLSGNARVINCFSYADVNGTTVGGIVGRNSGTSATTATAFNTTGTLIMNTAYFGHLSGTNIYPTFGGNDINNVSGVNTYNYYIYDATINYSAPNSAQGSIESSYFNRFDFYRSILNAHQELAAMYLFGTNSLTPEDRLEIAHWRYDDQIAQYLSLEAWPTNTRRTLSRVIPTTEEAYHGHSVGTVIATFIINGSSYTETLPLTDMDTLHWDYTYGKIILPFANEFTGWALPSSGSNNYDNIVTGWEVTSITGGTPGTYANYNLCDPECTDKDLYVNNNYVWAQGGNYVVPTGVTSITFTAHIGRAVYLSDAYYDIAYNADYTTPTNIGSPVSNTYNGKTIYTNLTNAFAQLENKTNPADQAIVLVGNYHFNFKQENTIFPQSTGTTHAQNKAVTIMSIDADNNQDPDYCFYQFHRDGSGRTSFPPIRFDFMASPGIAMASYTRGGYLAAIGIIHAKGWLEITETCTLSTTEFEFRPAYFNQPAPVIFNGGIYEKILMTSTNEYATPTTNLQYTKIGGKAYIIDLNMGRKNSIPASTTIELKPLNVSGGEIINCHLTGETHNGTTSGNVYFWCNGGYIHQFNGAYQEKVNGDIIVQIDHAVINEFFGGGADNAYGSTAQITGDIDITCNNSYVKFFCGGPKFGNMAAGKTVSVDATGTTFDEYYGASYGGTALTKVSITETSPNFSGSADRTYQISWTGYTNARLENHYQYGIGVDFDMDYFPYAGGNNRGNEKLYVYYATLSLAQTSDVTSTLTRCTINHDFYGGGCRGRVNGNVTSTLTDCKVYGNVFGGGYTPQATKCNVYPADQPTYPIYKYLYGLFTKCIRTSPYEEFTWAQDTRNHADASTKTLYTATDMSVMGEVTGNTQLTILGHSQVDGAVFGGGNESRVTGTTTVNIATTNTFAINEVYGGANKADVGGNTTVNITSGTIGNVFGANNERGQKDGTIEVNIDQATDTPKVLIDNVYGGGNLAPYVAPSSTPSPVVNIYAGTINHDVFGGGLGAEALVTGQPKVNINTQCTTHPTAVHTVDIHGSVYGGGSDAPVAGNPVVAVRGNDGKRVIIYNNVFGGGLGSTAVVTGNTDVQVKGNSEIEKNVYGGGNGGLVTGNTFVEIGDDCN